MPADVRSWTGNPYRQFELWFITLWAYLDEVSVNTLNLEYGARVICSVCLKRNVLQWFSTTLLCNVKESHSDDSYHVREEKSSEIVWGWTVCMLGWSELKWMFLIEGTQNHCLSVLFLDMDSVLSPGVNSSVVVVKRNAFTMEGRPPPLPSIKGYRVNHKRKKVLAQTIWSNWICAMKRIM